MPESVLEDLNHWQDILLTFRPTQLIPDVEVSNVGWIGDASTSYGIGVIVGKNWSQLRLLRDWKYINNSGQPRDIAWLETIAVRIGLQMVTHLMETKGKRFLVLTDNTVTQATILNRRSRNIGVNDQWKRIQANLIKSDCDIHQVYVRSADNKTDELSRGRQGNKRKSDKLLLPIPEDLIPFFGP